MNMTSTINFTKTKNNTVIIFNAKIFNITSIKFISSKGISQSRSLNYVFITLLHLCHPYTEWLSPNV